MLGFKRLSKEEYLRETEERRKKEESTLTARREKAAKKKKEKEESDMGEIYLNIFFGSSFKK